jgi:hypothetical protein
VTSIRQIAKAALDAPLIWHAVDISLLVSHLGLGHHEIVHNWTLHK